MHTLTPLSWQHVQLTSGFWYERQLINARVTIPTVYRRCGETGRLAAWRLDWKPGMPNEPHVFWDSDVAKWLEAAAYSLITHPNAEIEQRVEDLIALIARAQQPDGYLNTHFTVVRPQLRWTNLRDGHELYCAGHLMEAAVAHYQATGREHFLQVACRYADYIAKVFGTGEKQRRGYCGHEEIELALVKLSRATGTRRYLELAKYFVEERGRQPHYFDLEAAARGENPHDYWAKTHEYTQSHVPVREQRVPVGHAVRGMYLYCAMADLAAEYDDHELLALCRNLFQHVAERRMYVTGGLGSSRANEGYTSDYDLPNETAYAETCAAIALCLCAHRMLQIEADGVYADVLERALFNGVLSGVALAGDTFFYENPLASRGNHHRWKWHHCSCCPPNIARLLAAFGQFIYSQREDELYVHLYAASRAHFKLDKHAITLSQETNYPWDEHVRLRFHLEAPAEFTLALRIPTWCRAAELKINDETVPLYAALQRGYVCVRRLWESNEVVELRLPMPIERVYAPPEVAANRGRVALQAGPLVYCLEEADNGKNLNDLFLPRNAKLTAQFEKGLLGGVAMISGMAQRRVASDYEGALYRSAPPRYEQVSIKAIPYFAWDNRTPGEMLVWMRGE
ncbi:glycoside hydrolase family 127 protein [candidate division KSB1 bacterium]|nr:glycoside hydrolase family 127 protein [candidate division KSB1 bacterium]